MNQRKLRRRQIAGRGRLFHLLQDLSGLTRPSGTCIGVRQRRAGLSIPRKPCRRLKGRDRFRIHAFQGQRATQIIMRRKKTRFAPEHSLKMFNGRIEPACEVERIRAVHRNGQRKRI